MCFLGLGKHLHDNVSSRSGILSRLIKTLHLHPFRAHVFMDGLKADTTSRQKRSVSAPSTGVRRAPLGKWSTAAMGKEPSLWNYRGYKLLICCQIQYSAGGDECSLTVTVFNTEERKGKKELTISKVYTWTTHSSWNIKKCAFCHGCHYYMPEKKKRHIIQQSC